MKTILIICGLVLRFCLHLINTCIILLSCFFFVICFLKACLCVFYSICCLKLYLLIVPLLLFPYFLLHSFQAFLVPTYFFSRLCQGTTGPEGQRVRGSLATLPIGHLRPYPPKPHNTVTCDPTSFYCAGHTKLDLVTCDPTHPYKAKHWPVTCDPTYTDR